MDGILFSVFSCLSVDVLSFGLTEVITTAEITSLFSGKELEFCSTGRFRECLPVDVTGWFLDSFGRLVLH